MAAANGDYSSIWKRRARCEAIYKIAAAMYREAPPLSLLITRRAAGARERRDQPEFPFEPLTHLAQRQIMFGAVLLDLAQRHGLDEREIEALGAAPAQHGGDLVFIEALERHHVDLD